MLNKSKPYCSKILVNIIPYLRNNISISLALYAAIALLAISPLLLFNLLLQPVQAQTTTVTFKTPIPATALDGGGDTLTFDAQGTTTSGSSDVEVTSGTLQINYAGQQQPLSIDNFRSGSFTNDSSGGQLTLSWTLRESNIFVINTGCSASNQNNIALAIYVPTPSSSELFTGAVDCSSSQGGGGGGNTTTTTPTATTDTTTTPPPPPPPQQQPSSSPMTGSSQGTDRGSSSSSGSSNSNSTDSNSGSNSKDGDSDGIPDSSDRCTHNSNPRCFKEGSSTTTTTHEQEQPSTYSDRTGNQTR